MHSPRITIVIPTCNRPADLSRCLERLVPQAAEVATCKIVVCDDGTTAHTRTTIGHCFPMVEWHAGPKRGPAANRNFGAARANGDWLVFLDDDCIPGPDYVKAYHQAIQMERNHVVALEGPTVQSNVPPSLLWEAPHNPNGGLLISCNFAMPRELFLQTGAFDERYPMAAFEDTEFAARFIARGGRIAFVPGARAEHPLRRIPAPGKLAARWESRVIYALDQGASTAEIAWRLPWHCLRIIQARFRHCRWTTDNLRALFIFTSEWLLVVVRTPQWLRKWSTKPRGSFWSDEVARSGPVPKYGF